MKTAEDYLAKPKRGRDHRARLLNDSQRQAN